jgi:hypothetical protein
MMNQISRVALSIFVLFSASTAFAAPKVGDSATLTGTLTGTGINMKVTTFQKITAYDANKNVYTIEQTQTVGPQPGQTTTAQVNGGDMLTEETAAQIVAGCESQKIGTKENVSVGAGNFSTCKVAGENGSTIWITPVPFGVVKLSTKIPVGTIDLGMASFTRGQ